MFTSQFFGLKTTAAPQPFSGGTGKWNSWRATLSWFVARMWWLPFSTDELLTLIVQICSFHCKGFESLLPRFVPTRFCVFFYVMVGCCQACMCKQGYERHGMNFWNAIALLQTNGDGDPEKPRASKRKGIIAGKDHSECLLLIFLPILLNFNLFDEFPT